MEKIFDWINKKLVMKNYKIDKSKKEYLCYYYWSVIGAFCVRFLYLIAYLTILSIGLIIFYSYYRLYEVGGLSGFSTDSKHSLDLLCYLTVCFSSLIAFVVGSLYLATYMEENKIKEKIISKFCRKNKEYKK